MNLLPEYAIMLHQSGNDKKATDVIGRYLQARQGNRKPLNPQQFLKLEFAINGLSAWSETHPETLAQLREYRDQQASATGTTSAALDDVAGDYKTLQGKWVTKLGDTGSMEQTITGRRYSIRVFQNDRETMAIDGQIELRRIGPFRVIEVKIPGNAKPIQTVVYRIDGEQWTTASGFENKNNKAGTLMTWKRAK